MILLLVFVVLFWWAILKGLERGSVFETSREFEKPQIEFVIPVKRENKKEGKILDIRDYLKEKAEKEMQKEQRVQEFLRAIE